MCTTKRILLLCKILRGERERGREERGRIQFPFCRRIANIYDTAMVIDRAWSRQYGNRFSLGCNSRCDECRSFALHLLGRGCISSRGREVRTIYVYIYIHTYIRGRAVFWNRSSKDVRIFTTRAGLPRWVTSCDWACERARVFLTIFCDFLETLFAANYDNEKWHAIKHDTYIR